VVPGAVFSCPLTKVVGRAAEVNIMTDFSF
jgi:hypothetical protein